MEVVIIERTAFENLKQRIKDLKTQAVQATQANQNDWLDAKDVCDILHISTRTLHYYRTSGIMGKPLIK